MLGSAQVRACFAEKTVLCGKGFLAKCSSPHRSAPNLPRKSWSVPGFWANARVHSSAPVLPRKPCSAGKDSWLNAQVRTDPRRICRGNRGPCQVFGLMLGFTAPRRFCREHRAPCWFLDKMLRSAEADLEARVLPKCQETAAMRATTRFPLW